MAELVVGVGPRQLLPGLEFQPLQPYQVLALLRLQRPLESRLLTIVIIGLRSSWWKWQEWWHIGQGGGTSASQSR